ncbi:hypothetical protein HK102_009866, partial [Quaeritorhiza haematococci]
MALQGPPAAPGERWNSGEITGTIHRRLHEQHWALSLGTTTTRGTQMLIFRWLLGQVAFHQPWQTCDQPASRQHAIDCAEVEQELRAIYPDITATPAAEAAMLLDTILQVAGEQGANKAVIIRIAHLIGIIWTKVAGRESVVEKENPQHALAHLL